MLQVKGSLLNPSETVLDYAELGESIKASYRKAAVKYRKDDEIEITTEHHTHLKGILGTVSAAFGRPVSVLEAGCGTGRYFYCLKNVKRLVGLDVSEEMLKIAESPVRANEVAAANIELKCENIYFASFPPQSFDFIYSLGMFGHGCPVTVEICNKFFDWLAPGGQLFFDAVDLATLPFTRRIRTRIRNRIYFALPQKLKEVVDEKRSRVPFFGLAKKELEQIMRASRFTHFSVTSHLCQSPLWHGRHLECAASKPLRKDG